MKVLAAIGILCVLLQDKSPVTIVPDTPTDTAWPILGKANRPDGTVLKISAIRLERRWDPAGGGRFRESLSSETRLTRSAEVAEKAYKTKLKLGPTGCYELTVAEGEQRLHSERLLMGTTAVLFSSTRRSVGKYLELCDRASANLDEIQKVALGKQPGTAQAREAFIKRVHADELLLQEFSGKTDLTASAFLLNDVCSHIRNAQVWEISGKVSEDELNDGKAGGRDIFLDPHLNFKSLHATIESAKTVLSREISLSAATLLSMILARAEEKPERLLSRARDAASEFLKILLLAPVEDKEARSAVEAASKVDAQDLAEVRKGLRSLVEKQIAEQ